MKVLSQERLRFKPHHRVGRVRMVSENSKVVKAYVTIVTITITMANSVGFCPDFTDT